MINVRKGKNGELQRIIQTANAAFLPERDADFDFVNIQPKVYNCGRDTSDIHFVVEEDGKILSLAGSLPCAMRAGGGLYEYRIIGTVSTLPEYRNRGYMKLVMDEADAENRKSRAVFCALSGLRGRYNRYGFEKCVTTYRFNVGKYCVNSVRRGRVASQPLTKQEEGTAYEIFRRANPWSARGKDEFLNSLKGSAAEVFCVKAEGQTVGYYSYAARKGCIFEIALSDNNLLPEVMAEFLDRTGAQSITVTVNSLDRALIAAFDMFAEEKCLCDDIHIKVYDMRAFLEMLVKLNLAYLEGDICERVKIDGQGLEIAVKGETVDVRYCNAEGLPSYSAAYFLRCALGDGRNPLCRNSRLFPLLFGINECDMF